jgi:hypothetical protein
MARRIARGLIAYGCDGFLAEQDHYDPDHDAKPHSEMLLGSGVSHSLPSL